MLYTIAFPSLPTGVAKMAGDYEAIGSLGGEKFWRVTFRVQFSRKKRSERLWHLTVFGTCSKFSTMSMLPEANCSVWKIAFDQTGPGWRASTTIFFMPPLAEQATGSWSDGVIRLVKDGSTFDGRIIVARTEPSQRLLRRQPACRQVTGGSAKRHKPIRVGNGMTRMKSMASLHTMSAASEQGVFY